MILLLPKKKEKKIKKRSRIPKEDRNSPGLFQSVMSPGFESELAKKLIW